MLIKHRITPTSNKEYKNLNQSYHQKDQGDILKTYISSREKIEANT